MIHETAIIDRPCSIGDGTQIWHGCHVMRGAHIGFESMLGQNGFVASGARIGNKVRIQNNVSVYEGVIIEDEVFIGPSVVFTNVKYPRATRHQPYSVTLIKFGATIGANATILPGITVGEYAMVGAGAVVTKDVEPYALVVGNPARQVGEVDKEGRPIHSLLDHQSDSPRPT